MPIFPYYCHQYCTPFFIKKKIQYKFATLQNFIYLDTTCYYQYQGSGKQCTSNVYTRISGKCDGWRFTSLEECKRKCNRNEAPPGCASQPCAYVIWDDNMDVSPGWCQLATSSCTIGSANSGHQVHKKLSTFRYVGHGKQCANNVYTRLPGKCDGWARTGLEECRRKCERNEAPPGCPSQSCKFVIWDNNLDWAPGWCQLATEGCQIENANSGYVVYEKEC